jgi:hypothetical protein
MVGPLAESLRKTMEIRADLHAGRYGEASPFFVNTLFPNYDDLHDRIADALNGCLSSVPDERPQLAYDFMRDLVSAHNRYIETAARLSSLCCPSEDEFQRHVQLGQLGENRTGGFASPYRHYMRPSYAFAGQQELAARVIALHERMEQMIRAFRPGKSADDVRIRPQRGMDLCDLVIPYHYDLSEEDGVPELIASWNPDVSDLRCPSELPSTFEGLGPGPGSADNPLTKSLDVSEFLRIEGHLGAQQAENKKSEIKLLRENFRLPFDVVLTRLVNQGPNPQATPTPEEIAALPGYSEQARQFALLRDEVLRCFEQAGFALHRFEEQRVAWFDYVSPKWMPLTGLSSALNGCISRIWKELSEFDPEGFRSAYFELNRAVSARIAEARRVLQTSVANQLRDGAPPPGVEIGMGAAAYHGVYPMLIHEFRENLLRLMQDPPVNALLALARRVSEHARQYRVSDPFLWNNFIARHPGIEHAAGVPKGGTFVLVREGDRILADFQLPYLCCDIAPPVWDEVPFTPEYHVIVERDWVRKVSLNEFLQLTGHPFLPAKLELAVWMKGTWRPLTSGQGMPIWAQPPEGGAETDAGNVLLDGNDPGGPRLFLEPKMRTLDLQLRVAELAGPGKPVVPRAIYQLWVHLAPPLMIAADDWAVTVREQSNDIDLLANDLIPAAMRPQLDVTITRKPAHGSLGRWVGLRAARLAGKESLTREILKQGLKIHVRSGATLVEYAPPIDSKVSAVPAALTELLKKEGLEISASILDEGILELTHLRKSGSIGFSASASIAGLLSPKADLLAPAEAGEDRWRSIEELVAGDADALRSGRLTYRPNPGFLGQDHFDYRIEVKAGDHAPPPSSARVTIHVAESCETEEPWIAVEPGKFCVSDNNAYPITVRGAIESVSGPGVSIAPGPGGKKAWSFRPSEKSVKPGVNRITFSYRRRDGAVDTGDIEVIVYHITGEISYRYIEAPKSPQGAYIYAVQFGFKPFDPAYTCHWDFGDQSARAHEISPAHLYEFNQVLLKPVTVTLTVGVQGVPNCTAAFTTTIRFGWNWRLPPNIDESIPRWRERLDIAIKDKLLPPEDIKKFEDFLGRAEMMEGILDKLEGRLPPLTDPGYLNPLATLDLKLEAVQLASVGSTKDSALKEYRELVVSTLLALSKKVQLTSQDRSLAESTKAHAIEFTKTERTPFNSGAEIDRLLKTGISGTRDDQFRTAFTELLNLR